MVGGEIILESALAYVTALTGDSNTVMDWRMIHDTNKGVPAHIARGTLTEVYETLLDHNRNGYGIFCCINAMDGEGRELHNVQHIRTHVVDLDDVLTSHASYQNAVNSPFKPHFAVQTSEGKYHVYWLVEPYMGNDFYTLQQRKLRQIYNGDRSVIDASRVLRVPGFNHLKNPANPELVKCWSISDHARYTSEQVGQALQHVNMLEIIQTRKPLGDSELQAPTLEWLYFALSVTDPNEMDRAEWLAMSAAVKQAGWSLTDEESLFRKWNEWCARYSENDEAENRKMWNSIKDSEVGWPTIEKRTTVRAYMQFGNKDSAPAEKQYTPPMPSDDVSDDSEVDPSQFGEMLDAQEYKIWFKNCFFIEREGKIFTSSSRFMNSTQFNGRYGGKQFIITSGGKVTDEAWKAATRSTVWSIPKVDHVRFLPHEKPYAVVEDDLGRKGLNTYKPAKIEHMEGDVTLWFEHVSKIIPDANDRKIWFDYLAYCVKFPGRKIPWAPMLQSVEGVGKSVFFEVMRHALGDTYVYRPKAPELVSSGSKFNAWMRSKLMIVVDEIKIDERRELIEILKPMITEDRVEIQSKGVDQEMEDNVANWLFFSNYKDAIPINENGRRYAIFYSAIQTKSELFEAGMNQDYFTKLWNWLREENGFQYITHWLLNYQIEEGEIAVRAPETTSYKEAIKISRSPMEIVIQDAIEDGLQGFRGGYVSSIAVMNRVKASGIRQPSVRAIQTVMETMGYIELGKAERSYAQEDVTNKTTVYAIGESLPIGMYGKAQGYE